MRILFWNTHRNVDINSYILDIVNQNEIDVLVLAEYMAEINELNDNLKTKKRYTGFLQDKLIEILKEYLPLLNVNDFVVTQKGLHFKKADHKQIHRRLKPILDRLFNQGLKDDDITNRAVIHSLRHTFASHLAINGIPIFTIQNLMNHSDINTTMKYAKLSKSSGQEEVSKLTKTLVNL